MQNKKAAYKDCLSKYSRYYTTVFRISYFPQYFSRKSRLKVDDHIVLNHFYLSLVPLNADISAFQFHVLLKLYSHSIVAGGLLVIS